MINCPRCGAATAPGKFCAQCGAPLQAPYQPQPAHKPRTGLIIGLAAGGVVLLGLIGLGMFAAAGDSTPTPTPASSAPATSQPAGQPATGASKTAAKPGWVTGTVSDAAGRPLTVARDQVVVRVTGDL
ncbi:MAG TPA: zinc ribbon domain-containing protein, partial [Symbiobacteriaceae bacterium]|nr:zinc ribbon domain-containing protein [Symbiobacteriaceae bacterium]